MIQHGRWPRPEWTGKAWTRGERLIGNDRDRGPGEVGAMINKGARNIGAVPVAHVDLRPK